MEDFKELYEQAIEATFSGKLHRMLYDNELTTEPLSKENREAFRNLFQRYKDLRKLGDVEFVEVGLRDRMDAINKCGASDDSKKDSEMTIENINADRQMNIIAKAIAMTTKPDYGNTNALNLNKCGASTDSEKQDEKPVPNPMSFYIHNRDNAIEFIDKLKKIINTVGYVTVYQAYVLLDRLEDSPYNRRSKATDFNDCLLGWTDLSSIIDDDGSHDSSIIEDYYPCYQCSVRLPAPKYLTEERKEEN